MMPVSSASFVLCDADEISANADSQFLVLNMTRVSDNPKYCHFCKTSDQMLLKFSFSFYTDNMATVQTFRVRVVEKDL